MIRDTDAEIDAMFDQLEEELNQGKTLEQLREEEEREQEKFERFDEPERVLAALQRAIDFDMVRFRSWVVLQSPAVQRAASANPPNRIYQHADGPLCWIYGYARFTGRMIVKCIESDLELRDVDASSLTDRTKEFARHFGLELPGVQ